MPSTTLDDYLGPWEEVDSAARRPAPTPARPANAGTSAPSPAPGAPGGSLADIAREQERILEEIRSHYQMPDLSRSQNPQQTTIFTEQSGEGIIPKGNLTLPPLETKDEIVMIQFRDSFHSPALIIPDEVSLCRVKFMTPYNVYGYICGCSNCFVRWYLAKDNGLNHNRTAEWGARSRHGKQMIGHLGSFTGRGAIANIPVPRTYLTRL